MDLTGLYRLLLGLYPRDQRERFGVEMTVVFQEAAGESRRRGAVTFVWFAMREFAGLVAGAASAWAGRLGGRREADRAITAPLVFPDDVREVERIVQVSIDRMVYAIANHQFTQARFYSLVERKARQRLDELRSRSNEPE
jgi:hypothetical protein